METQPKPPEGDEKKPYDNTFNMSFWPPKLSASGDWLNRNGLAIVAVVCIITAIVLTVLALAGVITLPSPPNTPSP